MTVVVDGSGTTTPGASSLADLRRCVLDYVQGSDDSHLLDVATRAINMAIDKVNAVPWKRMQSTQDIDFVAGTISYDLSATFKEAAHCELLNSSDLPIGRIYYKGLKTLMEENADRSTNGEPLYYSIDHPNRTFVLDRPPSSAFISNFPKARLWAKTRLARLTNAADQHGGPPEFDRFLCWDARADVAAVRGHSSSADRAMRAAEQIFRLLRVDDKAMVQDWPDA